MIYQRILVASVGLAFLGLSVGCSDTTMGGKSPTKPAADSTADATASASDGAAPLNGGSTDGAAPAPGTASTDSAATGAKATPGVPATLIITKTITGLSALEDKPVTLTVAAIDANGTVGKPQTVTFNAGQSGALKLPNVCSGPATKIAVAVNAASGGGGLGSLAGLLGGGGGSSIATAAGTSVSSITFDPATCILTKLLQGNKGDTLNFACSDSTPVSVVSK